MLRYVDTATQTIDPYETFAPADQLERVREDGWSIHEKITKEVEGDPEIHAASNFTGIGNLAVNAFSRRRTS